MATTVLAAFLEPTRAPAAMCTAGVAVLLIGAWAARRELAEARGWDRLVALGDACFAAPLAVFGTLHLFGPAFVAGMVPRYMPWRSFWVYFVGLALVAAALSIASRLAVRWSGLLLGTMMFLFVAMIYLPGALRHPDNRFAWTVALRETSFGGAGWLLAATARDGWQGRARATLTTVGRVGISLAALLFGIEHFLHATGLPAVPLQREMPAWMPGREAVGYATGAALLVAGGSFLSKRGARPAASWLGGWILLLVLVVYGPVLVGALSEPGIEARVEGISYFADTLLFAGTILAVARAAPRSKAG